MSDLTKFDQVKTAPQWASDESLRLLLEAAPIAIVTVNHLGNILYVNVKLEEMFGYYREELIGQPVELLIPEHFRKVHIKHRTGYTANPHVRPMGSGLDLAARRKNGEDFPIEVGLSYVKVGDGLYIMGSITDITLRKRAEALLEQRVKERTREIERRRKVADSLRGILRSLNSNRSADDILNYIVAQATDLLGAKASAIYRLEGEKEISSIQTSQGLSEEYVAGANIRLGQGTAGQAMLTRKPVATPDITAMLTTGSDETIARRQLLLKCGYRAVLAVPLLIKEDVYGSLTLYYPKPRNFSTEQLDLAVTFADQAALAIENARLRTQVERAAVAAERSRLARDLHDAVTQTLFSATLIAEVLPKLWHLNPDEGKRRLEELRQLTRGALAEMRTLLLELRPSRLTEVPLNDLLRQLTEAVSGRARVPILLEVKGQCTLTPDVQVSLYRIAQEALNNVAKHAQANQAKVMLICRSQQVELSVTDDGRGFELSNVSPNSLGLSIMRERADSIGAQLKIKSQVGQGTQIKVVWKNKQQGA